MRQWIDALVGHLGSAAQYVAFHRSFSLIPLFAPVTHFINAPFGRFSVTSRFNVNGNIAWFCFEIVSPTAFALSMIGGPLGVKDLSSFPLWKPVADPLSKIAAFSTPTKILATLYLIHCLRTPAPRSPIHPVVIFSAVIFNLLNGTLMGTWLGGRTSPLTDRSGAVPERAMTTPLFWIGVGLWTAGFVGNLMSDEVLYNLRKPGPDGKKKERYSVPHGFLYSSPFGGISFPAYTCEWVEWLGFAIAACSYSPAPALPSMASIDPEHIILEATAKFTEFTSQVPEIASVLLKPGTYATPPFLFLYAEIATMVPRALKGHQWYSDKFGSDFPQERKAILPGIL